MESRQIIYHNDQTLEIFIAGVAVGLIFILARRVAVIPLYHFIIGTPNEALYTPMYYSNGCAHSGIMQVSAQSVLAIGNPELYQLLRNLSICRGNTRATRRKL
jgi:hypothetical protein